MATVLHTKSKSIEFPRSGEASYFLESEGDQLIKTLACKQTDTYLSLEKHFKYEKEFESAHQYLPITEFTTGTSDLSEFMLHSHKEEFSGNKDTGEQNKDLTVKENPRYGSRHLQDLAFCVKPDSVETKLLRFALSCQRRESETNSEVISPEHPINNLNEILDNRFGHLCRPCPEQIAKTVTRKRRQLLESLSKPIGPKPRVNKLEEDRFTLWDVTDPAYQIPKKKIYTCQPKRSKKLYTIKDGKIIPFDTFKNDIDDVHSNKITESNHKSNDAGTGHSEKMQERLTVEEIRKMPYFSNYEKGSPSKVLYLKNLSHLVTEDDLSQLFEKFQKQNSPPITYRLMKRGKMRGQAFITFNCIDDAIAALNEMNGVAVKTKPIIIQFGISKNC